MKQGIAVKSICFYFFLVYLKNNVSFFFEKSLILIFFMTCLRYKIKIYLVHSTYFYFNIRRFKNLFYFFKFYIIKIRQINLNEWYSKCISDYNIYLRDEHDPIHGKWRHLSLAMKKWHDNFNCIIELFFFYTTTYYNIITLKLSLDTLAMLLGPFFIIIITISFAFHIRKLTSPFLR